MVISATKSLTHKWIYGSTLVVHVLNRQFLRKSKCDCQLSAVYRMWIGPFRDTALYPPRGKSSVFKTASGIKCSEDFNMSKQRSFLLKHYSKLCCLRPMIRHVIAFHFWKMTPCPSKWQNIHLYPPALLLGHLSTRFYD